MIKASEPYERRFRALHPPKEIRDVHERLVETSLRGQRDLERLRAALARGDTDAARDAYAAAEATGESYDRAAASLGLVDCIAPPDHDTTLGYPPAPQRAGRTKLSWHAYRHAIDGICADNVARTVWGKRLIRTSALLSERRRVNASWTLLDASYIRLGRLIGRMGRPPTDSARYDAWLRVVKQRAKTVRRQVEAAQRGDKPAIRRLQLEIDRLDAEENWLGKRWGLRVCSSNGPAAPPGRTPSAPSAPSIAA